MKKILVLAVAVAVALLIVPVYSYAGAPQSVPTQVVLKQAVPKVVPKKAITTVRPPTTAASLPLDCNGLPLHFEGGDLTFRSVCFFAQLSGPWPGYGIGSVGELFVEMFVVNNSSTTAIPDGIGIYRKVIPNYEHKRVYEICEESYSLDTGYPGYSGIPAVNSNLERTVVGVPSSRAYQAEYSVSNLEDLKIIIDPGNNIVEENEDNNMILCTSFSAAPSDAFRDPYPWCLHFVDDRVDERRRRMAGSSLASDYVGPCTIINSHATLDPEALLGF